MSFVRTLLVCLLLTVPAAGGHGQETWTVVPPRAAVVSNVVIEPGDPFGWATPKDLAKVDRAATPPVSRTSWEADARHLRSVSAAPPMSAARSGGVLMLALAGGRVLKLFDQGVAGAAFLDGDRFHALVDAPTATNHYAVRVTMNEFEFYWLISATTGAMTSIVAEPVFSPDRRRAFGFRDEQLNGRELSVTSIAPERAVPDKVDWKPDENPDIVYRLGWASDGGAILVAETLAGRRKDYRLVPRDGAWRRE